MGTIKKDEEILYKINGKWSEEMFIQGVKAKKPDVLFDATNAKVIKKTVAPEAEQTEFESRRLWADVTKAIVKNDQDGATEAKTKIEDAQRKARADREAKSEEWETKHFVCDEETQNWTCLYSK